MCRIRQAKRTAFGCDRVNRAVGHGEVYGIADIAGTKFEKDEVQAIFKNDRNRVAHRRNAFDAAIRHIRNKAAVDKEAAAGVFIADHRAFPSGAAHIGRCIEDAVALFGHIKRFIAGRVAVIRVEAEHIPFAEAARPDGILAAFVFVMTAQTKVWNDACFASIQCKVVNLQDLLTLIEVLGFKSPFCPCDKRTRDHPFLVVKFFRGASRGGRFKVSKIEAGDLAFNSGFVIHHLSGSFMRRNQVCSLHTQWKQRLICGSSSAFGFIIPYFDAGMQPHRAAISVKMSGCTAVSELLPKSASPCGRGPCFPGQ